VLIDYTFLPLTISIRHRMTLNVVREFGKEEENRQRGEGNKEKEDK